MNPESPKMFQNEYPDAYRLAVEANELHTAWQKAEADAERISSGNSPAPNYILAIKRERNRIASSEREKFEARRALATDHMPEVPAD